MTRPIRLVGAASPSSLSGMPGPSFNPPTCTRSADGHGGEYLQYDAGDGFIDWASVTSWTGALPGKDYDPNQICPITCEELGDGSDGEKVILLPCSTDAVRCLIRESVAVKAMKVSTKCPVCGHHYDCPGPQPTGTLAVSKSSTRCEGFRGGSWQLSYNFPNGIQTQLQPEPGRPYSGTNRTCWYPDNKEGREAVELLKRGFERGHLFIVGNSLTTGQQNTVVWSSVHQKTSNGGGPVNHGWPDPEAFQRLKNECAAKGLYTAQVEAELKKAQAEQKMLDEAKAAKTAATAAAAATATGRNTRGSKRLRSAAAAETKAAACDDDDETTEAQLEAKAGLDRIQKEISSAMAARDTMTLRRLMSERTRIQAILKGQQP